MTLPDIDLLKPCSCCLLIDTTATIRGRPYCGLCKELCNWDRPCSVIADLEHPGGGILAKKIAQRLSNSRYDVGEV